MKWTLLHPRMTIEHLGLIPDFVSEDDPRSAIEQIDANYAFGGWQPLAGWLYMKPDGRVKYPGDPELIPLACADFRDETIYFYDHAFVGVRQRDGSFEVARLD
jgi:hypothetical protein